MNERIRELAEQASDHARKYVADCKHYGYYMEHNEYDLQFEQKFAELIVRECAELCREKGIFLANDRPNKDFDAIAFDCEAAIKQHFGVES